MPPQNYAESQLVPPNLVKSLCFPAELSYDPALSSMLADLCYKEKAQNAWHRRRTHKRQETPTTNPTDRQPTHLTDQAPSTIDCRLV